MIAADFDLDRPRSLEARLPPEARGLPRDGVRLLATHGDASDHRTFRDLPELLEPGDLLVVNESATVPASLPAHSASGEILLNLCTHYGGRMWLAEPRWGVGAPGPVPLSPDALVRAGSSRFRPIAPYPGIDRLWFFDAEGDVARTMAEVGRPIRYGYLREAFPLDAYQTVFARVPGSAEMPSAGRPFSARVLARLTDRGVGVAPVVLHAGVSSLEGGPDASEIPPVYPEPFDVPAATADRVNTTRRSGHRVVAVGTTVLRALETAWTECGVVPRRGFTRLVLGPGRPVRSADGLITGFHDSRTSHLALLFAFAGEGRVRAAYSEAIRAGYLWHEFGDSHLLWRDDRAG
jgi:S-adenosylmethionine:tRNA ribosyltransferase-isomerase